METFSALLALCAGNSSITGEFTAQRPVTRSFDVLLDLHLNNSWVNNREAGDLRRHRAHYDVIVMESIRIVEPIIYIISNVSYIRDIQFYLEEFHQSAELIHDYVPQNMQLK